MGGVVSHRASLFGHEPVPRDIPHGLEHAFLVNASSGDLPADHGIPFFFVFIGARLAKSLFSLGSWSLCSAVLCSRLPMSGSDTQGEQPAHNEKRSSILCPA
jgi:hypothetical protein